MIYISPCNCSFFITAQTQTTAKKVVCPSRAAYETDFFSYNTLVAGIVRISIHSLHRTPLSTEQTSGGN